MSLSSPITFIGLACGVFTGQVIFHLIIGDLYTGVVKGFIAAALCSFVGLLCVAVSQRGDKWT